MTDKQKENEKKKEYLRQYQMQKMKVKRIEEQINEVRINKMCPSLVMSDMPSAHNKKDLSDYIVQIDKITSEFIRARYKAISIYKDIVMHIDMLEDEEERSVLYYRYIKYPATRRKTCSCCERTNTWENIAELMHIDKSTAYRKHGYALNHLHIN